MSDEIRGKARLSDDGRFLTITTMAKKGSKYVENVQTYLVTDVRPDPRVAYPAYALAKGKIVQAKELPITEDKYAYSDTEEFVLTGEVWHVSVNPKWGLDCDCPHRTFHPNAPACKHAKAAQAVGLLPKESNG